jgi:hypothetical protein
MASPFLFFRTARLAAHSAPAVPSRRINPRIAIRFPQTVGALRDKVYLQFLTLR